jgi:hypothetical protein
MVRVYQKSEKPLYFGSPTTKAVGFNFLKTYEPTALVVGARKKKRIAETKSTFYTISVIEAINLKS